MNWRTSDNASRWTPGHVSLNKGGGPERVVQDDPDPEFVARPVGFAPPSETVVQTDVETTEVADQVDLEGPLLWEGDGA